MAAFLPITCDHRITRDRPIAKRREDVRKEVVALFIKCATDAVTLSVLLGFFGQVLKIADGRISGFSKCGLLSPLQDFSRTHSLYDPVTDGGGLSAVNQDVSNIAADLQPSIRRGFRLAQMSRRNQAQSLFPKSEGAVWNSKWDVVRLGFAEFSCMRLNFS